LPIKKIYKEESQGNRRKRLQYASLKYLCTLKDVEKDQESGIITANFDLENYQTEILIKPGRENSKAFEEFPGGLPDQKIVFKFTM